MLPFQKYDGFPLAGLKVPIDSFRFSLHFREEVVIAFNVSAAGRANLHECEFALVLGIFFQKSLNRPEALQNSLGVVHAVDADPHERRLQTQVAHQSGPLEVVDFLVAALDGLIVREVHADWERPNDCPVVLAQHRKMFPVHA